MSAAGGVKRIAILGSTGSIGRSALAVVDAHADRLQVIALAAGENVAPDATALQNRQRIRISSHEPRTRHMGAMFPPRGSDCCELHPFLH